MPVTYAFKSSFKPVLKYEDTSHIEPLHRKIVPFELITKAKVTLLEKREDLLLCWNTPLLYILGPFSSTFALELFSLNNKNF